MLDNNLNGYRAVWGLPVHRDTSPTATHRRRLQTPCRQKKIGFSMNAPLDSIVHLRSLIQSSWHGGTILTWWYNTYNLSGISGDKFIGCSVIQGRSAALVIAGSSTNNGTSNNWLSRQQAYSSSSSTRNVATFFYYNKMCNLIATDFKFTQWNSHQTKISEIFWSPAWNGWQTDQMIDWFDLTDSDIVLRHSSYNSVIYVLLYQHLRLSFHWRCNAKSPDVAYRLDRAERTKMSALKMEPRFATHSPYCLWTWTDAGTSCM